MPTPDELADRIMKTTDVAGAVERIREAMEQFVEATIAASVAAAAADAAAGAFEGRPTPPAPPADAAETGEGERTPAASFERRRE